MKQEFEVLIIGGGPAGISSAMTLGRLSRTALLCDDDRPRNYPSSHVNNFPTNDGIHPAEWRKLARQNLEKYKTIQSFKGSVLSVERIDSGFLANLSSGTAVLVKKVILAYGVKDRMPDIPGFIESWGKDIFHCPFCHGYEIRGATLGLIANTELAFHALPMIHSLAANLIVFSNGMAKFSEEQKTLLKKNKVELIENKIVGLDKESGRFQGVLLDDGRKIKREFMFYAPTLPFELKSNIGGYLGCAKNDLGFYKISERNETSVPGVYACGDNVSMAHSVLLASASGFMAGASAASSLLMEKFEGNLKNIAWEQKS